jgi:hypothetical protein
VGRSFFRRSPETRTEAGSPAVIPSTALADS